VAASALCAVRAAMGEIDDTDGLAMDSVRYLLAAFLVVTLPALFLYWLLIHPFVNIWRGKGIGATYSFVLTIIAAAMVGLFSIRHYLLAEDFGTSFPLMIFGVILLILSGSMGFAIHKQLGLRTLLGLPEIAPDRFPRQLITDGLYGRMRHPRYVQLLIVFFGFALIANHFAVYLVVALWLPGIYVIALLEEKELQAHFGQAYEEYCRRVPRFLPKLRRLSKTLGGT
jgi:protein-S-isoprenylcysteine O-methyltransferase Ste14